MIAGSARSPASDKRVLARVAARAATEVRLSAGYNHSGPICIFELCERLGIIVRFTGISMDGIYVRGAERRIYLSAQRPLPRRAFTCGHELGHDKFGHASTIDELLEEHQRPDEANPDEYLADAFAAHVLMPAVGLHAAFASRRCDSRNSTHLQMYALACSFGVGYSTLITHLCYGLREITTARAKSLLKHSPKAIGRSILGSESAVPLVLVDAHWGERPIDAEVGTLVVLPSEATASGGVVAPISRCDTGLVFQAIRPGAGIVTWPGRSASIRVSRREYVGLARYQFMADDDV